MVHATPGFVPGPQDELSLRTLHTAHGEGRGDLDALEPARGEVRYVAPPELFSTASAVQTSAMAHVTGSSQAEPAAPIVPPLSATWVPPPDGSAATAALARVASSDASAQPVSTPSKAACYQPRRVIQNHF